MRSLKNLLNRIGYADPMDRYARQYRLIWYISLELIAICLILIFLYSLMQLWHMVVLFSSGICIALINLWVLSRTANTFFCGHLITLIAFIIICLVNYMIWGIGTLHNQWFYIIPLLAAALVGRSGLIIYSILSFFMILGFSTFSLPPFYNLPYHKLEIIEWGNHLLAYLIVVTTLVNLLYEHDKYERKLTDLNYLLQSEKDKYHYLARVDQLTNLPNRRYFNQYLQEVISSLSSNYCATLFLSISIILNM